MQQRFQDSSERTTPLLDNETVRDVLARAAEIEARPKQEALTAAQVEALGRELGLSPDAIRQALQEKVGVPVENTVVPKAQGLPPVTRKDVKVGAVIGLLFSLFAFATLATGVVLSAEYRDNPSRMLLALLIFGTAVLALGPLLIPFVYAWRRRDWRQGLLVSIPLLLLYSAAIPLGFLLGNVAIGENPPPLDMGFYFPLAIATLPLVALGGWASRWWHERKLIEDR